MGISVGLLIGAAGCLDSLNGDDEADRDDFENPLAGLETADEFADEYSDYRRRIENAITDYERGQELLDREEFSNAETHFRDANREFEALEDDLISFETDLRIEYGQDSDVIEVLEPLSGMIVGYKFASGDAHKGTAELVDGNEAGWILATGSDMYLDDVEIIELPSEHEFRQLLDD